MEQKKNSLNKIGVNLKADRAKVLEADENSDDSDIKKFNSTIKQEKVEELSKRLHKEAEEKYRAR